jgi:hypothetical protein
LEEAYSEAIVKTDCGLVARNLEIARLLSLLFAYRLPCPAQVLDHAGGYGLLVRLLRDAGFDAWWEDSYCVNMLARGFSAENGHFEAVTMCEVLEHLHEPYLHLAALVEARRPELIIITTTTYAGNPPMPGKWSYYAFETGQHITFFQERTLIRLASMLGYTCERLGMLRVFSRRGAVPMWMRVLADRRVYSQLSWLIPRRASLLPADHAKLRRRLGGSVA